MSTSYVHNANPLDYSFTYFHFFSQSERFLILPLNSIALDLGLFFDACRVGDNFVEVIKFYVCSENHTFNYPLAVQSSTEGPFLVFVSL